MHDTLEKGRVYTTNRRPFKSLGEHQKAIEYHKNRLKIAMQIGDRGGEAAAYGNLGNCYQSLSDYRKSICLLYTSPSPRDGLLSRMPSSA